MGPVPDTFTTLADDPQVARTPDPLEEFSESLLTQMIPRLLGGEGRVDVAPSKFIYSLTCPLAALDNSRDASVRLAGEARTGEALTNAT